MRTLIRHITTFAALSLATTAPFAIAAPGSLDSSFGIGGKVTTPMGSRDDEGYSAAMQTDGKIVVAGYSYNGADYDFSLVRYTSTGALDPGFGNGGKVTAPVSSDSDYAWSVTVQSDGKIVVAGRSWIGGNNSDFALVRYTTAGTLDTSFGSGGMVTTDFGSNFDVGYSVAVQSDGKIVVAGCSEIGGNRDFALARYTSIGALDTSFGIGGKVITPIGSGIDECRSLVIQHDGKIVVVGYSLDQSSNSSFALARYTNTGALDTSYGSAGKVTTNFGSIGEYGESVALQTDGKIVVAGVSYNGSNLDFALVRYTNNGVPDTSFGNGGIVTTPIGSDSDYGRSVAVQSDGKIVVAGSSWNGNNDDFALVRYTSMGTVDNSFGSDGKVTTGVGNWIDVSYCVALQADGKIVVAGQSNFNFALVRYNGDPMPEIQVEVPAGTVLTDGYNNEKLGTTIGGTIKKTFTIRNVGPGALIGIAVSVDGGNSADYSADALGATSLEPGTSTSFTLTFAPSSAVSGTRAAALHIASNDADENPFDIALNGTVLSTTADADGDGLNDWGEYQLSALGFDWQLCQPSLVTSLKSGANAAGLYTPAQVQALNLPAPLIQRNPATGEFTLTLGIEKSATLQPGSFTPFPISAPQIFINGVGKLEFKFTVPDNAAFFRLGVE